ncbi:hypothetical protein BDQ17DRAFT_1398928 [Cyathus striatus]|nr:hypothetical protein BDQ17DRAFT_1398928 [Cyathus striatus]
MAMVEDGDDVDKLKEITSYCECMEDLALAARSASTPMAVRRRRARKLGQLNPGENDATKEGLTPSQEARYKRLVSQGQYRNSVGKIILSRTQYALKQNKRASRIRGFRREVHPDGTILNIPVGRKVYLPNITFRLVRNHTPHGQPYNPYEATFRVPNSVTKTDIRSYLAAVYDVKTTYIRTDNYFSPEFRARPGDKNTRSYRTYKRAVVGLVDPFYYPHRLEDMEPKKRQEREEWIEANFNIERGREMHKMELLRMSKGQGRTNWKFNSPMITKRSQILRLVAERRAKREDLVAGYAQQMKEMRNKGKMITVKNLMHPIPSPPEFLHSPQKEAAL